MNALLPLHTVCIFSKTLFLSLEFFSCSKDKDSVSSRVSKSSNVNDYDKYSSARSQSSSVVANSDEDDFDDFDPRGTSGTSKYSKVALILWFLISFNYVVDKCFL